MAKASEEGREKEGAALRDVEAKRENLSEKFADGEEGIEAVNEERERE